MALMLGGGRNTATYYVCTSCQSFHEQPLGRAVEKPNAKTGAVDVLFKTAGGPSTSGRCDECDSPLHVAGPMWSAPIHNTAFVEKVLAHLEANSESYGTVTRMKGMLTVAKEVCRLPFLPFTIPDTNLLLQELHSPFYFTPTRIAGAFHSTTPSLDNVACVAVAVRKPCISIAEHDFTAPLFCMPVTASRGLMPALAR